MESNFKFASHFLLFKLENLHVLYICQEHYLNDCKKSPAIEYLRRKRSEVLSINFVIFQIVKI